MRTILSTIVDPEFAAMVKEEAARRNTSISRLVKESLMTSLMTSKGEERNEKERSKGKVKKGEETERDSRVREEVPPAFVEVEEYAQQSPKIRAALEEQPDMAAKFYDFYQSKGWLVGAAPMKNWKSAFRNWVRRRGEFQPRKGGEAEKVAARDAKEKRERERRHCERLEAAKRPESWELCAERCANFRDGKCAKGAKWPPQFNDRPIPPQECKHFSSVDKNK